LHQGVREKENKRDPKVKKKANDSSGPAIWNKLIPELLIAIISPSELSRPKLSRLANKSDTGMTMSKKEGILNNTSLPTSARGAFSMKMSSVRSNMMPMNSMKLKKMNPKIKVLPISFRI